MTGGTRENEIWHVYIFEACIGSYDTHLDLNLNSLQYAE